jgi:hypothetical protein
VWPEYLFLAVVLVGGRIPEGVPGGAMTKSERLITRNMELSAEFSRHLFEHPELEEKIPVGAEIVLLPEFDPELKKHNLRLARKIEKQGGQVILITIKKMRPKRLSRIESLGVSL